MSSCTDTDSTEFDLTESSHRYTEDNIVDFIKFEENPIIDSQRVNIIIFSVKLHRSSRGCLYGFGFCKFKWFPGFRALDDKEIIVGISDDCNDNCYFDLLIEDYPEDMPLNLMNLNVDEDLTAFAFDDLEKPYTIKKGVYNIDLTLGSKGGYRIFYDN